MRRTCRPGSQDCSREMGTLAYGRSVCGAASGLRGPSFVFRLFEAGASREFAGAREQQGNIRMNKSELIEVVAQSADLSKAAASRAIDAFVASVTDALKEGDPVTLVGFGTFTVRERAARTGRNPRTGESITIPASKTPGFKAGKALKDAVN